MTDANLVLGRLNPDYFLAGTMALNRGRAGEAVAGMGQRVSLETDDAALAIVQLANESMANALRLLTVERGIDPREFDLVAFGGAGPLHAVALAEAVGIRRVIVPPHAGLTSALGTLLADLRVDRSWTHAYRSNDLDVARINARFDELTEAAWRDLRAEGFAGTPTIARSISMRYLGQNYEQDVPVPPGPIGEESIAAVTQRFHQQHEAFYGYSIAGEIMELIHFNVSVIGATPKVTLPRWPARSGRRRGGQPAVAPGGTLRGVRPGALPDLPAHGPGGRRGADGAGDHRGRGFNDAAANRTAADRHGARIAADRGVVRAG